MTRPVDSKTSHSWQSQSSPLAVLEQADVVEIIRLAETGGRDSGQPAVVSASEITPEELQAHTERKRKIMQAIDKLGVQGRAELNAVMLYGRDGGEAEDFPLLVKHSQNATSDYIASKSPLSRYLTDGLAKLGL